MKIFLNSKWQNLNKKNEVLNPFDGSVIDTVPSASPAEITAAIDGLAKGAETMRQLPSYKRVEILRKTGNLIREQKEEIYELISSDEGKILAVSRIETSRAA